MTEQSLNYLIDVLKGEKTEEKPEWYEVLGFLECHKTAGLFYNRAKERGMKLPPKIEKLLLGIYDAQVRRNRFMRKWIEDISEELQGEGLEHIFLKGSVLSNAMGGVKRAFYKEGERISNDIDILVRSADVGKAGKVLKEMGFIQGEYDKEKREILPLSRLEIVNRRLNRGETAPFLRATENAEVPYIEVDVNFSLGYVPGEGQALQEEMLKSRKKYKGFISLYAPDEELFFLHLLLHQYKESELMFMVERNKELDLYKLADIYYFWREGILDEVRLKKLTHTYGIKKKAGAVLRQAGKVFDDESLLRAALEYDFEEPCVIDFAAGKRYRWSAEERKRIAIFDARKYLRETEDDR